MHVEIRETRGESWGLRLPVSTEKGDWGVLDRLTGQEIRRNSWLMKKIDRLCVQMIVWLLVECEERNAGEAESICDLGG